jgi:hypothetical protein
MPFERALERIDGLYVVATRDPPVPALNIRLFNRVERIAPSERDGAQGQREHN